MAKKTNPEILQKEFYRQKLLEMLQDDYPEYIHFFDYLVNVLEVMGLQPGDDYEIIIEDLDEPSTISITMHPTYGS